MQKVLIVDDSKTIRVIAQMFLKKIDAEVLQAVDGFEALSIIQKEKPVLIFVDIIMPKIDGYKLCSMIKSHPECKNIPVIVLSSKNSAFDKAKGKLSGCDGYLVKPFTEEDFTAIASRYLQQ